jgi:nitrite reductase/ring-hydroxylating ferredoxin subunit/uncharacterized membrane protein
MKTRASYKGHALHQALIPFPFAFLYGAFFFDLAGALLDRATLWTTGGHLAIAGVAMALVAAVPGFIDYLYSVPPRSTGKRRASKHALTNLLAVALFAVAWWLRRDDPDGPRPIILVIEGAALCALTAGAWMGGTLVSRNQIGVDHRYARAGKWREQRVDREQGKPVVLATPDLEVDQLMLLHVEDRRIVLACTEDGFVAFDDRCTHRGGSLADGVVICGTVQCPWHGSQFDVRSGAVRCGPAEKSIIAHRVEESEGQLLVHLR